MKERGIGIRLAGAFFLIAIVSSIIGGGVLDSLMDLDSLLNIPEMEHRRIQLGFILEMINALCVLGIAVLLNPVLQNYKPEAGLFYLCFRLFETITCIIAAVVPLLAMALLKGSSINAAPDSLTSVLILLIEVRGVAINLFLPMFFSMGAFVFYFIQWRTRILPRFIALWGILSTAMIVVITFLPLGFSIKVVLAIPIILNETLVGVWLLTRGINQSELDTMRTGSQVI